MRTRQYLLPPPLTSGYELDAAEPGWLSVIIAAGAQNLIANPSFELGTTGWATDGTSITRVATEQHNGVWSLECLPGAASYSYYSRALTSGVLYYFSVWFKAPAGKQWFIEFETTASVALANKTFTATGRWQREWVAYKPVSTATHRMGVRRHSSNTTTLPFYLDGAQLEVNRLTTYLDGDMKGLVKNRTDFYWLGVPHASLSTRIPQCRTGGVLMPLKQLGFHLLAIIGLSMAPVRDSVNSMARGGAQFQDTTVDTRPFTIVGFIEGEDSQDLGQYRQALIDAFKPDAVSPSQPVTLQYQLSDCGEPIGDAVNIVCNYQDGLRGDVNNNNQERLGIQFNMYLPLLTAVGSQGHSLAYTSNVTDADYAIARVDGNWVALGSGMNGAVRVVRSDPGVGRVYYGGEFTTGNGVTLNYIGYWDIGLQTFVAMGTGLDGPYVADILIAPNHDVWVVGRFATASGAATTDLARWNYALNTWTVFPVAITDNGGVHALGMDENGKLYIGGDFKNWNGIAAADYMAGYSPAGVWTAEVLGLNNVVRTIAFGPDRFSPYVGGDFTTPVIRLLWWDFSGAGAVDPLAGVSTPPDDAVRTISFSPTGIAVAGGFFTVPVPYLAYIDGSEGDIVPKPLGGGVNGHVYKTFWDPATLDLYAAGEFSEAGGLSTPDRVAVYSGGAWTPLGVNLPGAPIVRGMAPYNQDLYLGYDTSGTAVASAGLTTLNNIGSAEAYPRIYMTGPATVVLIRNETTGKSLFFDLTLLVGETAVLDLAQDRVTFVSSFRGNILSTILPGSNQVDFILKPGENKITVDYVGTVAAATLFYIYWLPSYHGIDGLIPSRIIVP